MINFNLFRFYCIKKWFNNFIRKKTLAPSSNMTGSKISDVLFKLITKIKNTTPPNIYPCGMPHFALAKKVFLLLLKLIYCFQNCFLFDELVMILRVSRMSFLSPFLSKFLESMEELRLAYNFLNQFFQFCHVLALL